MLFCVNARVAGREMPSRCRNWRDATRLVSMEFEVADVQSSDAPLVAEIDRYETRWKGHEPQTVKVATVSVRHLNGHMWTPRHEMEIQDLGDTIISQVGSQVSSNLPLDQAEARSREVLADMASGYMILGNAVWQAVSEPTLVLERNSGGINHNASVRLLVEFGEHCGSNGGRVFRLDEHTEAVREGAAFIRSQDDRDSETGEPIVLRDEVEGSLRLFRPELLARPSFATHAVAVRYNDLIKQLTSARFHLGLVQDAAQLLLDVAPGQELPSGITINDLRRTVETIESMRGLSKLESAPLPAQAA